MAKIWVVSDTHFNHANILKFEDSNGNRVRPFFTSVQDMNEFMIAQWNSRVSPSDHVWHLGDVYFGSSEAANNILSRLMGKKRLILGNHDNGKDQVLQKHFQKIVLWRQFTGDEKVTLTHVPMHESGLIKTNWNVHGHIHQNKSPTDKHYNACVEHHDYAPILLDDIVKSLNK